MPPAAPRLRVLVVDDDAMVLKAWARALSRHVDVTTAHDAQQARELLTGGDFHVLVSDHAMAGESGLELLRYAASNFPQMRRVMVTGHVPPGIEEALERGEVHALLEKPAGTVELLAAVRGG